MIAKFSYGKSYIKLKYISPTISILLTDRISKDKILSKSEMN